MLARLFLSILTHLTTPPTHAQIEPPTTPWVRHVVDANDHPAIERGNSDVVDFVISSAQ